MKMCRRLALLLPILAATAMAPIMGHTMESHRSTAAVEDNAEQRINFSGKLRMLSQRIPAAACHLVRGVDPEGASALLQAAPVEFEKILTALEFGDPDLNIQSPEQRRKSLVRIHELRAVWTPMKSAATALANGTATDAELEYILNDNMTVLGAAVRLVSELVKQYSNPNAVPYANLLLVDISGRQRMLTQKMSKESCLLGTVQATAKTPEDLQGTMRVFAASLGALRHGLDEVGIKPPPTDQIAAGLDVVYQDWVVLEPTLAGLLAGQTLARDVDAQKFQSLNTIMANMNKVVGLYANSAKPMPIRNLHFVHNDGQAARPSTQTK